MTSSSQVPEALRPAHERGQIGGRTVQLTAAGEVEVVRYEPAPLADDHVRIHTVRSAISPGTEMTFYGAGATNAYLHRRWNEELRLFEAGAPTVAHPLVVGYRAAGVVVESRSAEVAPGARIYGNWGHTELVAMPGSVAASQLVPDELTWDDAVDIAQMGPICVNAVAYAEGAHAGLPTVIFGAGVVGLVTAQVARATGAQPVHVVDRVPERLQIAASLGFEPVDAAPGGADVAVALKRRYGSEGIPVVWECTGSSHALHEAIRTVRRRGTVVAVGFYQGDASGLALGDEFHHNGIRMVCGQIGNLHPSQTWESLRAQTIDLTRMTAIRLGDLPRLTLPVEEAAAGFAALRTPGAVLQAALTYD